MNIGGIRTLGLIVALAMVVGACGGGEEPETPTASVPVATAEPTTAPTEAPATEPAEPFAIPEDPADIDEAYVERVLEELGRSIAEAARIVVREGRVTRAAKDALAATHRGKALKGIVGAFEEAADRGRPQRFFARDAKRAEITVEEVLSASSSCIFTRVLQDTSPLAGKSVDEFVGYYQLSPKRPVDDELGKNKTPWMIAADGRELPGGQEYADPCA